MTDGTILTAVRAVMRHTLQRDISDTQPLVSSGLIDSLMILRLIAEIEHTLHITLDTSALQPEDFDTVALAVDTIGRATRGD